jgi:hypothetical protein
MIRPVFACALSLLLLAGCADVPLSPPPVGGGDPALAARCRAEAERLLLFRDRGQAMRNEEMDTRSGTFSAASANAQSDRLGQRFELDRLTQDCIREAQRAPAPQAPAAARPAPRAR